MLIASDAFKQRLNSTHRKLHYLVDVYDTWFGCPSNGISFRVYEITNNDNPDWAGKTNLVQVFPSDNSQYGSIPNLQEYWGSGNPYGIPDLDRFAIEYTGYFDVDPSIGPNLAFRLAGSECYGSMVFNGSEIINQQKIDTFLDRNYISGIVSTSGLSKTAFSLRIHGKTNSQYGGFVLLYQYANNQTSDEWYNEDIKIVNAGVVNDTDIDIGPVSVKGVLNISGQKRVNEPTKYSFTVPFSDNGYIKDPSTGAYVYADDNSIALKEGKLVKIYAGYAVKNADDTKSIGKFKIIPNLDPKNNIIDPSSWYVKTNIDGSDFPDFNPTGKSTENEIVIHSGPYNNKYIMWKAGNDADSNNDGGFNTDFFDIDKTALYKMSVFFMVDKKAGTFYFGCGSGTNGGISNLGSGDDENTNPYFCGFNNFIPGKWYYAEGYIHPYTFTETGVDNGGIYDCDTGKRVASLPDFKFMSDAYRTRMRVYHFYDTDTENRQYIWNPRWEKVSAVELERIEMMPRLTGIITDFKADTAAQKLTVECSDVLAMATDTFAINIPNRISYWANGYIDNNSKQIVNTDILPIAYDAWHVDKAIKDIFVNAGIPAELLYGKELRDVDSGIIGTDPMIAGTKIVLSKATNYSKKDGSVVEYIYKFDVGTKLFEAAMKIIDTYGYALSADTKGWIKVSKTNNASSKIVADDYSVLSGTTSKVISYKALSGYVLKLENAGDYLRYSINGNGVQIIFMRNTSSGNNDNNNLYWLETATPSVEISIFKSSDPNNPIFTTLYNLYYDSDDRYYRDGFDYAIGENPCIVDVVFNLDYDNYIVQIKNLDNNYETNIDSVVVFNSFNKKPIETLQTYRYNNKIADLSKLNYERGLKYNRNDILVIGKRLGVWVATGEDNQSNNSLYRNVYSRSIDINAIYNKNVKNYIGRKLTTYIQEPKITDFDRAKWLSFNMLSAYRDIKNHLNFTVIGNPLIENGDCVTVQDKHDEKSNNNYWVKSISESIKDSGWLLTFDVDSNKPYPSYEEDPDIDISNYHNNYAVNVETYFSDNSNRFGGASGSLYESIKTDGLTELKVHAGDIDFKAGDDIVVANLRGNYEPHYFVYHVTGTESYDDGEIAYNRLYGNVVYTTDKDFFYQTNEHVTCAVNPYEVDDRGVYVGLRLSTLVRGRIRVGVYCKDLQNRCVAGLSDGGGFDGINPKWEEVYPGMDLDYIWGFVDNVNGLTSGDEIGGGFFVGNKEYYLKVDYYSYHDDEIKTYNNYDKDYYNGDGSVAAFKSFKTRQSLPDAVKINVTNDRFNNEFDFTVNGSTGPDGRKLTGDKPTATCFSVNQHVNYAYFIGDQPLDIEIQSNTIKTNRSYQILAYTEFYKSAKSQAAGNGGIAASEEIVDTASKEIFNVFGDNAWMLLSESDNVSFEVDLANSKWLGYNLDNFYKNCEDYWFFIHFHIIDKSGRLVYYAANNGSVEFDDVKFNTYDKMVYRSQYISGTISSDAVFATATLELKVYTSDVKTNPDDYSIIQVKYSGRNSTHWEGAGKMAVYTPCAADHVYFLKNIDKTGEDRIC